MRAFRPRMAVGFAAVVLASALCAEAASPEGLSGSIGGRVSDSIGVPQMGATILLFDGQDRLLRRILSDETGSFLFDSIKPDVYSIRVSLASFVPALRQNIIVQPGMRSLLNVNLTGVFSSIELVYSATGGNTVMREDWKWALRSSTATRPVLRMFPHIGIADPAGRPSSSAVFSDTRGLVKVSAGDQGLVSAYGNEPDLGTAFALATSVFGSNQLQLSGNLGYSAAAGIPAAGFRTRYSRDEPGGSSPEVRLTMRQWFLPTRAGVALLTRHEDGVPALRTMSVGFMDTARISDDLNLEYGFSLESVSFLERLNYFSPYARLSYEHDDTSVVEFGFSSGVPPAELFTSMRQPGGDLNQDLAAVALFPRVSLRDGRARVQRAENFEIAYRTSIGTRIYSLAAYRESLVNAATTMVAPANAIPAGDLLPDLTSNSSVFNVGEFASIGYMLSVAQSMGDLVEVTVTYGSGSVLTPERDILQTGTADELRGILRHGRRHSVAASLAAKSRRTGGTQILTGYRWADRNSLTAGHTFITQRLRQSDGLNIFVRQPIPGVMSWPGSLEATADLRNLLGEGYVPLTTSQGQQVVLMHTPRSVRGGLSFIF